MADKIKQKVEKHPICVEFKDYQKSFSHKEKIGPLSFSIRMNKLTIIVGRSGSGKSVILNSLVGSYSRYKGKIWIYGVLRKSLHGSSVNGRIGYYTQMDFLSYDVKLEEYLKHIAKIQGISKDFAEKRIRYLLDMFELYEHREKKIRDFSWGMKNRLNLILSLIKDPDILFYDEPGANLDSVWRAKIRSILMEYKKLDKTVVIVDHNIDEIFDAVDDLILIDHGQIIFQSEITDLKIYLKTILVFKSNIVNNSGYGEFKETLIKSGFVIFDENIEMRTLEIGILKQQSDRINFLVAWLIKYNIFLQEMIKLPINYDTIYNSLLFSDRIKELEFYYKNLSWLSQMNLKKLLKKSIKKDKKVTRKYAENQSELIKKIEDNKRLLLNIKDKDLNFKSIVKLVQEVQLTLKAKSESKVVDKTSLEDSIKKMISEEILTKLEETILKIALDVYFDRKLDTNSFNKFYEISSIINSGQWKFTKKMKNIVKVNHTLINDNKDILDHKNKLFW